MASPGDSPEIQNRTLRQRLFLPHLDRLLKDPTELSLEDSIDSIRVRLDQAIASIEGRSSELIRDAQKMVNICRLAVGLSAVIGAGALIVGLVVTEYWLFCMVVAAGELIAVVWFSRQMRQLATDASELKRLGERYRPLLDASQTVEELRELSLRIGAEMVQLHKGTAHESHA